MNWWEAGGLSLLVGAFISFLYWYEGNSWEDYTKGDGARYWHLAGGDSVPFPFNLRWFWPWVIGERKKLWRASSRIGIALIGPATVWYLELLGLTPFQAFIGSCLFVALPGVSKAPAVEPLRIDSQAIVLIIVASCVTLLNPWLGLVFTILAGFSRETSPILIALFTWNPWMLIGMLAPLVSELWISPHSRDWEPGHVFKFGQGWWERAFESGHYFRLQHFGRMTSCLHMILPWGIVLPVFLLQPTLPGVLALILGYSFMFVATDYERVYQHAGLALIPAAAIFVANSPWVWVLLVLHFMHPWNIGRWSRFMPDSKYRMYSSEPK